MMFVYLITWEDGDTCIFDSYSNAIGSIKKTYGDVIEHTIKFDKHWEIDTGNDYIIMIDKCDIKNTIFDLIGQHRK